MIKWKWPFDLWPLNGKSDAGVTVETFVSHTMYNMLTESVCHFKKATNFSLWRKGHWSIMTFCWPLTWLSSLTFLFCSSIQIRCNKPEQNRMLLKIFAVYNSHFDLWPLTCTSDVGVSMDTFVSLSIWNMLTMLVLPFEEVHIFQPIEKTNLTFWPL